MHILEILSHNWILQASCSHSPDDNAVQSPALPWWEPNHCCKIYWYYSKWRTILGRSYSEVAVLPMPSGWNHRVVILNRTLCVTRNARTCRRLTVVWQIIVNYLHKTIDSSEFADEGGGVQMRISCSTRARLMGDPRHFTHTTYFLQRFGILCIFKHSFLWINHSKGRGCWSKQFRRLIIDLTCHHQGSSEQLCDLPLNGRPGHRHGSSR